MAAEGRLIVGAMSGTSADGVDVALVRVTGRGLEMKADLLRHHHRAYDEPTRAAIFAMRGSGETKLAELAALGRQITLAYGQAVNDLLHLANLRADEVAAIAAHGQTLYHAPPDTIQWFDPSLLANRTGCAVVSDFRRADCAAGGQGAPLVPFADYLLFQHPTKSRVLLNIGGIANLTYLRAGGSIDEVIAFDTGPGNCIIDLYARKSNLPDGIDRDGQLSLQGQADFQLAFCAIRKWSRVFQLPPKSTDGPEMIAAYEQALRELRKELTLSNHLASACLMTALGVDLAKAYVRGPIDEILVSGGGTRNPQIMREIAGVTKLPIARMDSIGMNNDAKEAVAFAMLGAATLDGEPSNVPSATGASRRVVLGSITPRP